MKKLKYMTILMAFILSGASAMADITAFSTWNNATASLSDFNLSYSSTGLLQAELGAGAGPTLLPANHVLSKFGNGMDCAAQAGDTLPRGVRYHANPASYNPVLNSQGTIEFWYNPDYDPAAGDRPFHVFFSSSPYTGGAVNWSYHLSFDVAPAGQTWSRVIYYGSHAGGGNGISVGFDPSVLTAGTWHHIAYVWNNSGLSSGNIADLYIDGSLATSSYSEFGGTTSINWQDGQMIWVGTEHIGAEAKRGSGGQFDNLVIRDNVQYSGATYTVPTAEESSVTTAHTPTPASPSTVTVSQGSTLSWLMGEGAVTHKVYWSDVFEDVNSRSVTPIVLSQAVDGNSTSTPSTPVGATTYYWAVDEVNSLSVTADGFIWLYSVRDFVYVDDMEDYDLSGDVSTGNEIWNTWVDGYLGTSGSAVTTQPDGADNTAQGMEFTYSNNGNSAYGPSGYPYYSEVVANTSDLECGSDWTAEGVEWLQVWFKGNINNDPNEGLYLVIEDSTDANSMVQFGQPDSYSNPEWVEDPNTIKTQTEEYIFWGINLQSFSGVNLSDVQKVYIGFGERGKINDGSRTGAPAGQYQGTVMIDEIKLRMPGSYGPTDNWDEDLYDDGVVDLKDLAVLANRYLDEERDGWWP